LKIDEGNSALLIVTKSLIGDFCHIAAVRKVVIADNVLMANRIYISDNVHTFADINQSVIDQPVAFKNEVTIGEGAWLGENVCVIGASVGKNSVVGANSVVTKDIPDFCVAIGTPARVVKKFDFATQKWVSIV